MGLLKEMYKDGVLGRDHQKRIHPGDWCVSAEEFKKLVARAYVRYAGEDPSTEKVTREMIREECRASGLSYALQTALGGTKIDYFITHNWSYSFRKLAEAILTLFKKKGEGNVWICFLANPQTWPYEELNTLLGDMVWQSPFVLALREAKHLVVVRDRDHNIYSRLWCTLERAVAAHWGTEVLVLGPKPSDQVLHATRAAMGTNASATDPRDVAKIRSFISGLAQDEKYKRIDFHAYLNELCMAVVSEDAHF